MLKKILAILSLAMLSETASAALVVRDYLVVGDELITYDSSTNLEWLDLRETNSQSYDDVMARITAGDLSGQGWAYATGHQFDIFVGSAGGTPMTCPIYDYCGYSYDNNGVVLALQGYLGKISTELRFYGILGDLDDAGNPYKAYMNDWGWVDSINSDSIFTALHTVNTTRHAEGTGSFLVRTPEVPIPAAAYLFASAILGLGALKRKTISKSTLSC